MSNDDRFIRVEDAAIKYGVGRELMKKIIASGFFDFACKAGDRYIIERVPFERHLADTDPAVRRIDSKRIA